MRNVRIFVVTIILVIILCVSGYCAWQEWVEYREGRNAYAQIRGSSALLEQADQMRATAGRDVSTVRARLETDEHSSSAPRLHSMVYIHWPTVRFDVLESMNPDVVGWLYGEDTSIDYPVVRGEDNSRYLNTLFDGRRNDAGCLFLDAANAADFSDTHSIVYGHNRKDGSMFGLLAEYKDQSYYDAHPFLLLVTPSHQYVIELFSGYVAYAMDDAWKIAFNKPNGYEQWLMEIAARSMFIAETVPTVEDRVITLSTCDHAVDNGRFVLHGALKAYTDR